MSTRERWMLGAIGALVVILIGVGIAVATGGGGNNNSIDTTASTLATTTSGAAATTTTTTTSGSTPVTVGIICTTPEDAAKSVVSAWGANDRAAADRCASPGALDDLFKASGAGNTWMFQDCGGPDPGVPTCQFSYEGGAANFKMAGTEAAGWKVDVVTFVAD